MHTLSRAWLTWVCLVGTAACDESAERPPPPRPRAPTQPALSAEAPATPWPDDIENLRDSIEAFESLDACRARIRSAMPIEVAEGLSDMGYDTFTDDACGALAALKARSADGCDELSVSVARRGCRRRLAMWTGDPDVCPDDSVVAGREPTCVAWAARDEGLCRGAPAAERRLCRAVLRGDVDECEAEEESAPASCRAQVVRYASALGDDRHESDARGIEPRFELTASRTDGEERRETGIRRDVLDRGVVLEARGCRHVVRFASPMSEPSLPRHPWATVELPLPRPLDLPARVPVGASGAEVEVSLPGIGRTRGIGEGTVTITALAPTRGARIHVEVEADLSLAPGSIEVRGELETFVRDVDALADSCR